MKNELETVRSIRQRAEKGDALFQYMLGETYERGNAVPQDGEKARKWHRKAFQCFQLVAEQGDPGAQYKLALVYSELAPQNYVESYKWVKLAASKGRRLAGKELPRVAAKMTREELAEAKRLVREWRQQWKRKGKREWKRKRQERRKQFSNSIRCQW